MLGRGSAARLAAQGWLPVGSPPPLPPRSPIPGLRGGEIQGPAPRAAHLLSGQHVQPLAHLGEGALAQLSAADEVVAHALVVLEVAEPLSGHAAHPGRQEWNQSVVPCPVLTCFLTCIQVSQEAGQVVLYSHLLKDFPQFVVIHTVKGFGIVNKAKVDDFLELSCFFYDPTDIDNLISDSSNFCKSTLNITGS